MNPTSRIELQDAKAKAQQGKVLVSQARMVAKGGAAAATGPVGALKGANLIAAAGGSATVSTNLGLQSASLAAQKVAMQQIAQLKTQAPTPQVKAQVLAKQRELRGLQRQALQYRDLARNAVPEIMKVVRLLQF